MPNFFERPFVLPSTILGITLIIGLGLVGYGISSRNSDNIISVTGSASVQSVADRATWRIDIRRSAFAGTTEEAYAQVAKDSATVIDYFNKQNLASSTVTGSVISTDENYRSDQNAPVTYTIRESVTVQTTDVDTIDKLSRDLSTLTSRVGTGTILSPQNPEYYVSSLPQLRISFAGKAVEDAKARAIEIAKSGGSSVGALKSASSGVVQVLSPNSTNVDDYGSYDTSTIKKQVMVTTRAVFYVK